MYMKMGMHTKMPFGREMLKNQTFMLLKIPVFL